MFFYTSNNTYTLNLFFLFIIFTFIIYLIYYIFNPTINSLNYFKTNFKNWTWKW